MSKRKVTTELEMDVARFVLGGGRAGGVAREVKSAIHDLGDEADATSRDMDQLALNTDMAKRQVDDLGDEARQTAASLALLQGRIDATRLSVRGLALEFARTGDAETGELLRDTRAALAQMEQTQKLLVPAGAGGGGLFSSIPRIGGVPGPVVGGIGATVVALSPFLGGIIAAAVLGGVGTGGLIGGIALAAQDTRVKSAWKALGHEVFVDIGDAASPFVQPLIGAASTFGDAWRKELPGVQRDFAILSRTVDPLARGVAGFAHNLHPGLTTALTASVPLAEQFGEELEGTGTATGEFLRDMARSAPGARIALHDLFTVFEGGLDMLGDGVVILSDAYEGIRKFGLVAPPEWLTASPGLAFALRDIFNPELEKSVNNLNNIISPTEELARAQETAADAAKRQADALAKLNRQVDDYYAAILKPFDANERWHRSLLDLDESLKDNGRTLDIHTRAGLANRDAIEEQFEATKARLDAGTLTEQEYQREIVKLGELKTQFRDTTGFVDALVEAYKKTPSQIRSTLTVMAEGSGLSILLNLLKATATGRIPLSMGEHSGGQIRTLTQAVSGSAGGGSRQAFLDLSGRAAGGPVYAGQPLRVNEQRLEAFVAPSQGYVLPLVAGASPIPVGGGGWEATPVVHVYIGGERIDERVDVRVEMANRRAASDVYARPRL